jgi:hypothetical protein
VNAVVLEVESKKRRSGWVQVVHRTGLGADEGPESNPG